MIRSPDKKSVLTSAILTALAVTPAIDAAFIPAPGATVTPSSRNVSLNSSSPASFVWSVPNQISPGCGPSSTTVSSTVGQFRDACGGGTIFGSINTTLTTTQLQPDGTTFYTFSEAIIVPADVSFRAQRAGLGSFAYQRSFTVTDGFGSASDTECVTLNITSTSAAGFGISRMALTFDGGAPTKIVARRASLRASAEVNFNGNGMLQAVWEIANPASTAGEPAYRTLSTVRQYLVGADKQILQSPALPTDSAGLYLLRLRVTDPAISFDTPVIRYFVTDERAGARMPALSLSLTTPPNQILLAPDTAFSWEAIRGARAYQLELYARPRGAGDGLPDLGGPVDATPQSLPPTPPVTGMLVPGTQTRAVLSGAARSHLVSGRSYLWRVLAIGGDGSIVGESPVRELRMP